MADNRKKYADLYKGIAITLVVIGHTPCISNELVRVIYSFHMPAFFFIYGLMYQFEKHRSKGFVTKNFIIDKVKRLLIPCWIWGVFYMLCNLKLSFRGVAGIIYGSQAGFIYANSLSSLWFLPCMFVAVVCFEIIIQKSDKIFNKRLLFVILFCVFAAVAWMLPHFKYGYPFGIDSSMIAVIFIILSYLLQPLVNKRVDRGLITMDYVIAVLLLCILLLTYRINLRFVPINNVDLAKRYLGNIVLYLLDAFSGCIALLYICIFLSKYEWIIINYVVFLGRVSLIIMIIHKPIVIHLSELLKYISLYNSIGGIIASLLTIAVCSVLSFVLDKYTPFLFGKYIKRI